jgi:hypothetical protein
MAYKLLGFVVWRGAKWYVGRRLGALTATRKVLVAGGLAAAAAAVLVAAGAKKNQPSGQLRS